MPNILRRDGSSGPGRTQVREVLVQPRASAWGRRNTLLAPQSSFTLHVGWENQEAAVPTSAWERSVITINQTFHFSECIPNFRAYSVLHKITISIDRFKIIVSTTWEVTYSYILSTNISRAHTIYQAGCKVTSYMSQEAMGPGTRIFAVLLQYKFESCIMRIMYNH